MPALLKRGSWLIVTLSALAFLGAAPPATPHFDSSRAYGDLRQVVAFGPRPAGSPALAETRGYIEQQLKAAGVRYAEQPFDASTPIGTSHMVNVIATIPGKSSDRLLITGHYDTKLFRNFRFVGANDAGSSTAGVLELARVLQDGPKPALTIELVFFDGEEATRLDWAGTDHTYGSQHYVDAARKDGTLGRIKAMILLDMIGDRQLDILRDENSTTWLTDIVWRTARRLGFSDVFLDRTTQIEDDHIPFLEAGVPSLDIIDLDYAPWHTASDTLDKVSARSLQTVGDVVLAALPEIEDHILKSK
jgi:Zn-dependent M28 family amino/carboxypeptidase